MVLLCLSSCCRRVVGSIRGHCANTVSPLPPRFTGFQPFLLPPFSLNLLALYPLYGGLFFNLYLPSTDESYYPLTPSIPCPLCPLLPLVLLLLVVFINPHLYSRLHFLFLLSNFLPCFLSLHLCVYRPVTAVYLDPSNFFFSPIFPVIGRQMLTLAD